MNVACPGCGTRYAVADDKVRGRRVRIACKHCSTPIIVDGTGPVAAASNSPPKVITRPRDNAPTRSGTNGSAPSAASTNSSFGRRPPPPTEDADAHRDQAGVGRVEPAPPVGAFPQAVRVPVAGASGNPFDHETSTPDAMEPKRALPIQPRKARIVRQTIIGVAAPANAPDAAPVRTSLAAGAVGGSPARAVSGEVSAGQDVALATRALSPKPPRTLHRTIIGVAAPANAPPADPNATTGPHARPGTRQIEPKPRPAPSPNPKTATVAHAASVRAGRTMIGGLEAAAGSAPTPQAPPAGSPTDAKWSVLIPKQGAVEMSAPEILRAFADGRISRDNNVWREGMEGWERIGDVDPLRLAFQRAGLPLTQRPPRPMADDGSPRPMAQNQVTPSALATPDDFPAELPTTVRGPVPAELSVPPLEAANHDAVDVDITRIAASPWQVPDVGAQATARLATSAGLPPRQNTTPPSRPREAGAAEHPPLDRPSRRPDIGPRATVRGQLAALSSAPTPASDTTSADSSPETVGESSAQVATPTSRPPAMDALPLSENGAALSPSADAESLLESASPEVTLHPSHPRKARRRWIGLAAFLVVAASLGLSYRTRQPQSAYAYMHRHGWDAAIDRTVKRSGSAARDATQTYVVKPYRRIAEKFRERIKK